jgi:hypothetical protein
MSYSYGGLVSDTTTERRERRVTVTVFRLSLGRGTAFLWARDTQRGEGVVAWG